MIVVLIALLSLSAIYFTRLLYHRNMKLASIATAVLYLYVVLWIYAVFILDLADLGFADVETHLALLHGSNIYHSFIQLTTQMSVIPLPMLKAIVAVVALTLTAAFIVAFDGLFEITRAVIGAVRTQKLFISSKENRKEIRAIFESQYERQIIRMHCRMNC